MLRRILFISLVIALTVASLGELLCTARASGLVHVQPDVRAGNEALLKSTVLIRLYGPKRLVDAEAGVYEIETAKGLGTLIFLQGQTLLLTHDHWKLLDDELQHVEYRDAMGNLLTSTGGSEFINGIRYRDGGTIIVKAPARLVSRVSPAPTGTIADHSIGAQVQVVRRSPDSQNAIAVMNAVVEAIESRKGKQVLVLRSTSGEAVVPGDSGGGIYFNGKLVGNLWTAITEEVKVAKTGLFGSTTKIDSIRDQSRAAVLTKDIQSRMPDILTSVPPPTAQTGREF